MFYRGGFDSWWETIPLLLVPQSNSRRAFVTDTETSSFAGRIDDWVESADTSSPISKSPMCVSPRSLVALRYLKGVHPLLQKLFSTFKTITGL